MILPNNEYWKGRMEALEDANNKKGRAYTEHVEKQFRIAQKNIEDKIEYWYAKLADNNELTMQGAKRLLRADELEDFKLSIEEYIEKGEMLNYHDTWKKQLENASAKVHISRLEALKMQMQQECEVLYGNMLDGLDGTLRDMYTNSYYHTAYEFMKGTGVGWAFNRLDTRRIENAINTVWANDGKTFSSRIWTNKQKLVQELNTVLVQNIIRGESPQRAIAQLAKRMNVSKSRAGTLIMTESAFIHSQSQKDCYKELDVEKLQFVATLDGSTSEICQAMDGVVIDMTDYKIGLNIPPLHPRCRSCTVPYFEDEVGMRAARGEDGKTYRVPGNMTYKDWKKSFVDGDVSDLERVRENVQKMKPVNKNGEEIQFDERLESDERWNDSLDVIKNMSNEYDTKLTLVRPYEKGENRTHAAGDVSPLGEMRLSSNKQSTAFHEFAHSLATTNDKKYGLDSQEGFWKEIRKIRTEYKKACRENYRFRISLNAEDDIDEFMAEAFTQAKMKQLGLELDDIYGDDFTYSNKVLAVVDKYFKKEAVENVAERGIIKSGAISGARNPLGDKAKEHAQKYYGLVRSMKTDVAKISKVTGMPEDEIQSVKNFIFLEKHDLGGKELEYFEPDYMMAESWRRLIEGKPEQHDITLLKHEVMEKELMGKGLSQEEAHIKATEKYNYSKEAGEYYAKIKKYKD